jgi:hypothetical protein
MICAECKWYKKSELQDESNDLCTHVKAKYATGKGIREPVVMGNYSCYSMLCGICKDHELWQPKLEVA